MKANIHPKYEPVTVTCSCGSSFETRSALGKPELFFFFFSWCNEFYTGKQKVGDRRGRVERFNRRYGRA